MQRITITLPDSLADRLRAMGWLDAPEFTLRTPPNRPDSQPSWFVLFLLRWLRSWVQPKPSATPLAPTELVARFAGTLPESDAAEMLNTIQQDCRQIDHDGW